ncbi:MAG: AEC family transporter [Oscillospiraceae bacterium]|jgi:predicted permease|nr:AEC family transporter [Oscillospiraceae bacterium]
MGTILIKAGSFVLMIVLGYTLKRIGFFKKEDFSILSKIVLNITLPCAVITNFSTFSFEPGLMLLAALGIGTNLIMVAAGWLKGRREGPLGKGFGMLNLSGYNIGCFTMPYAQSFLGPVGVVATCIFDAGNAIMCNGVTYGLASSVSAGGRIDPKAVLKKMFSSVTFDTYAAMLLLAALGLSMPAPVLTFTEIVGGANSFMAMLMIGVGFELRLEKRYLSQIGASLLWRYALSAVLAAAFYFLTPFSLEVRQVLAIVVFAPVSTVAVPYSGKIGGDIGLAGAINSATIVVSLTIITALLLAMGL